MSQHPDRCLLQYVVCDLPNVRHTSRCSRLVSWVTTTTAVTFVGWHNFLTKESLRETTSAPLLRVLNCFHPDCFFRKHYWRYTFVLHLRRVQQCWMSQHPDCCLLQYSVCALPNERHVNRCSRLVSWVTTTAVTFVVWDNNFLTKESLRETTSAPLLRVLTCFHPDCFFREHYWWYTFVLYLRRVHQCWMSQYPDRCLLQYVVCALPNVRHASRCSRLVSWVTTATAVTFVGWHNFLTKGSLRETTSAPLLRVLNCFHPDCFFRERYWRYTFVLHLRRVHQCWMSHHPDRCLLQYSVCALPNVRHANRCSRLVSWVTTTAVTFVVWDDNFLTKESLRETTSAPLLRVLTCFHLDCFFREHYWWYTFVLYLGRVHQCWMSQHPDRCLLQ